MKCHCAAALVLEDEGLKSDHVRVHEDHALGEKISWNPRRADITACRPSLSPPLGIEVLRTERAHTFFVGYVKVRQQDIFRFEDVVLHLDATGSSDVDGVRHV